jgi:hypothetical protein
MKVDIFEYSGRDVFPHAIRVLTKCKYKHLTQAVRLLTQSCVLLCFVCTYIHSEILNDRKIMIQVYTYCEKLSLNIH